MNADDIIARAQSDLSAAQLAASNARSRMEQAEREAMELASFLATFARYAGGSAVQPVAQNEVEQVGKKKRKWSSQPGTMARTLVDECIAIIHRAGHPVQIGDLLDGVMAAGLTVGGADQKSNLAGYLSRDPRTSSVGKRGGGWIVSEDEGAAPKPTSQQATPSLSDGGTNERTTLVQPGIESATTPSMFAGAE
ncbi:hypothetical protein KX816_05315 [Sphingosinicellaceae bacterium]|nr:hypothetical protein KX816_05315 [Sphingosinicellaceae bacterium]